jgi:replicative DNA helicase
MNDLTSALERQNEFQEREPPHSDMAEQGVIGSILVSRGAVISQCRKAGMEPAWFFVPAHATIFQQLCDAHDAGKPIELDTFTARLGAKNLLAQIGGEGVIAELFCSPDRRHIDC